MVSHIFDPRWKNLADFIHDDQPYGKLCTKEINGKKMKVLPLVHPRQIAKLGQSSSLWYNRHQVWIRKNASKLFN
jgi:hypothetical protein